MTKSTVQNEKDKDSLPETGAATQAAFPELFKTKEPIIVKPLSLETAGSELYAAIMNGEVQNVRSQLQHGDKVSEGEAVMLIRAREKAREKGAKRYMQALLCAAAHGKGSGKENAYFAHFKGVTTAAAQVKAFTPVVARPDVSSMEDTFGGRYTAAGYEMPDGSFLSASGAYYNAVNRILTLADGKAYKLVDDLPVSMAEVMNTANKVRSVRESAPLTELEFINADPKAADAGKAAAAADAIAATIAIVADAANIAAKAEDERAARIMETDKFAKESERAPAAAIGQLDGSRPPSVEDIHIAIQLHRRALRERRADIEIVNEEACREIAEIRDGLACLDTSSLRRVRCSGEEREGISVSFNPVSPREPVMIVAVTEVGRSLKACFRKAGNGDKPKAGSPSGPRLVA